MILDETHVYWVTMESSPDIYFLNMMPLAGGVPTILVNSAPRPITAFARDSTHIYWLEEFPGPGYFAAIRRMPLGGGSITTVHESDQYGRIRHIVVHNGYVFFLAPHGDYPQKLLKVPVSGGTPETLTEGIPAIPKKFVSAGAYLYWIDDAQTLQRISVDGGEVTVIYESTRTLRDLAANNGYLLLVELECGRENQPPCGTSQLGRILRMSLPGGQPESIANGLIYPGTLSTDSDNVYWVEGADTHAQGPKAGSFIRIGKVPIAGGNIETFLYGISGGPKVMAVDSVNVYVADGWYIKKIPRNGGHSERIAEAGFYIDSIATDGAFVYCLQNDPMGVVFKVPVDGGTTISLGYGYGSPGVNRIHVVDGYVYWNDNFTICKVSVNGGPVTEIASELKYVTDMVVDGENIFFYDEGLLNRVSVNGGDITTLAYLNFSLYPYFLTMDNDHVYWINEEEISKVRKDGTSPPVQIYYGVQSLFYYDSNYGNDIVVDGNNNVVYWSEVPLGTIKAETTSPPIPPGTKQYKLKAKSARKNKGSGIIVSNDGNINCGETCFYNYFGGTTVTLSAAANQGSTFIGWKPTTLNCNGANPCTVTIDKAKTVQAIFVGDYTLKLAAQGKKGGTGLVSSTPTGISCSTGSSAGCAATYPYAQPVTLSASPNVGSTFLGWNPAKLCPGIGECVVTMDKKRNVKAVFLGE